MRYTVKILVASRVALSDATVDVKADIEANSPREALQKAAQMNPTSTLSHITRDPGIDKLTEDILYEGPEGIASEYDGEIITMVAPTATGTGFLWKKLLAWESQFQPEPG